MTHEVQVAGTRLDVVPSSGEVAVCDAFLLAVSTYDRSNGRVVVVLDAREQVMFDLVVEATVEEAPHLAAHVGSSEDLSAQERLVLCGGVFLVIQCDVLEVM